MLYILKYWRLGLLLCLLALYPIAYVKGHHDASKAVHAAWDLDKARANSEARSLEQARQRRADESVQLAAARTARLAIDARNARADVDSLRDAIESTERASQESLAAANQHAHTLGELLGDCSRRYQELAAKADGHAGDVILLLGAWPK